MGNNSAWILVIVAVVLGFSAGLVVAQWSHSDATLSAEPTDPNSGPTPTDCLDVCESASRLAADTCQDTDAKLEQCHAALMASWANASHPIEVAELDSSFNAAQRFAEAYYADDDPEVVEKRLSSDEMSKRIEELLGAHDMEMGEFLVSCDPLPCAVAFDLTYVGDATHDRETLDPLFDELEKGLVEDSVTHGLDGYHAAHPQMRWGRDPAERSFHSIVSTHSEDEIDTLLESMILFADEVLGDSRFE